MLPACCLESFQAMQYREGKIGQSPGDVAENSDRPWQLKFTGQSPGEVVITSFLMFRKVRAKTEHVKQRH